MDALTLQSSDVTAGAVARVPFAVREVPRLAAAHAILGAVIISSLGLFAHTTSRYGHTFMMVDGYLYYTHARSWYFDADCDYANDMMIAPEFDARATYMDQLSPAGRATNLHPCAWSVVAMPFLAVADGLTVAHNALFDNYLPRDGYSAYYLAVVPLSNVLAGLGGLLLAFAVLRRYYSETIAAGSAAIVWCGTHVVYFVSIEPTQSHALSMAAVTLMVWATDTIRRAGWTWKRAVALGIGCGTMVACRYLNVIWVIIPAILLGPSLFLGLREWSAIQRRSFLHLVLAVSIASLCLLPQIIVNIVNEGGLVGRLARYAPSSWLSPKISVELLDPPTGLLVLYPLVAISFVGLCLALRRRSREPIVVVLALGFAAYVYVYACSYDNDAGYPRRYVCCFLLFSIGIASLLQWCSGRRFHRVVVGVVIGGAVLHNLALMAMVDRGLVSRNYINRGRFDLMGIVSREAVSPVENSERIAVRGQLAQPPRLASGNMLDGPTSATNLWGVAADRPWLKELSPPSENIVVGNRCRGCVPRSLFTVHASRGQFDGRMQCSSS